MNTDIGIFADVHLGTVPACFYTSGFVFSVYRNFQIVADCSTGAVTGQNTIGIASAFIGDIDFQIIPAQDRAGPAVGVVAGIHSVDAFAGVAADGDLRCVAQFYCGAGKGLQAVYPMVDSGIVDHGEVDFLQVADAGGQPKSRCCGIVIVSVCKAVDRQVDRIAVNKAAAVGIVNAYDALEAVVLIAASDCCRAVDCRQRCCAVKRFINTLCGTGNIGTCQQQPQNYCFFQKSFVVGHCKSFPFLIFIKIRPTAE